MNFRSEGKQLKLPGKDCPRRVKRPVEDNMDMRDKLERWRLEKKRKQEEEAELQKKKKIFKPSGSFKSGHSAKSIGSVSVPAVTSKLQTDLKEKANVVHRKPKLGSGGRSRKSSNAEILRSEDKTCDLTKSNIRRLSFTIQEGASPLVKGSRLTYNSGENNEGEGTDLGQSVKCKGLVGKHANEKNKRHSLSTKHRLSFGASVTVAVNSDKRKSMAAMKRNSLVAQTTKSGKTGTMPGVVDKRKSLSANTVRSSKPGVKTSTGTHLNLRHEAKKPKLSSVPAGTKMTEKRLSALSQPKCKAADLSKKKTDSKRASMAPRPSKRRTSLGKKTAPLLRRQTITSVPANRRTSLSKNVPSKGRRQTLGIQQPRVSIVPRSAMKKPATRRNPSEVSTDIDGTSKAVTTAVDSAAGVPTAVVDGTAAVVRDGAGMDMFSARLVRFTTPVRSSPRLHGTLRKTPRTELSMREKLNAWLKEKGKTPSRFRNLMFFGAHLSARQKERKREKSTKSSLSVKELTEQQAAMAAEAEDTVRQNLNFEEEEVDEDKEEIDQEMDIGDEETDDEEEEEDSGIQSQLREMLEECATLFEAGCPAPSIISWLDEIESSVPSAKRSAGYWVVRAKVTEGSRSENDVLDVFEEAMKADAKPPEPIVQALQEFVIRMEERCKGQGITMTPRQPLLDRTNGAVTPLMMSQQLAEAENIFESSAVKFCIKEQTPYFQRLKSAVSDSVQSPIKLCAVVTPVRRSTRRSCANLPTMLHDHDTVVSSVRDIPEDMKENVLFKPNKALLFETEAGNRIDVTP